MPLQKPSPLNLLSFKGEEGCKQKTCSLPLPQGRGNSRVRYIIIGCILLFFPLQTSALLGEDLGLDLYKQIDEGVHELDRKQYEYEITGQGETSIAEVVDPILKRSGLDCNIQSSKDIEKILGNSGEKQVAYIVDRCGQSDGSPVPTNLVGEAVNVMSYIKNTYTQKAYDKSDAIYNVARTGIYNDGSIENSPFDLITDLQDIDAIIFSEEIPYEGVEKDVNDRTLDDFLSEDKSYLYEDEEEENEEDKEEDDPIVGDIEDEILDDLVEEDITHNYVCRPTDNLPDFDSDLLDDLEDSVDGGIISNPYVWVYSDDTVSNGASWGGPFPGAQRTGTYNKLTDEWGCDPSSFFCIVIEFVSSDYGLTGGETLSIEKIIKKASEHLEKPANASLTQRKMTTNNFELGSIIKNLPDMLRGFGMEVSSQPIPILDLENKNSDLVEGDIYEVENLLYAYYKNNGLDYDRANDLSIFGKLSGKAPSEEEQKIIQTSAGMGIQYSEVRLNELKRFQTALRENNRLLTEGIEKQIIHDDMKKFTDSFAELEQFVDTIEDFVSGLKGTVEVLEEIPSRSS